jgi:hypothetical protein
MLLETGNIVQAMFLKQAVACIMTQHLFMEDMSFHWYIIDTITIRCKYWWQFRQNWYTETRKLSLTLPSWKNCKYFSSQWSPISEITLLFEDSQASQLGTSEESSTKMKVGVNQWWNYIDMEWMKYWNKNLFQCHSVYQKSHMGWPRVEIGSP